MYKVMSAFLAIAASPLIAETCSPSQPAACNQETCNPSFCLGPAITQGNAPVRPYTCDGDLEISASALYWKASQSGMEYAYMTNVGGLEQNYNLVDADYLVPGFKWEPGYRVSLNYSSPCDGWDIGIAYTSFEGSGHSNESAQEIPGLQGSILEDFYSPMSNAIVMLWSGVAAALGNVPFVGKVETTWRSDLHMGDIELGRSFWASPRYELRPSIGIRILSLDQKFTLLTRGGYWQEFDFDIPNIYQLFQPPMNGEMNFTSKFRKCSPIGLNA